MDFTVRNTDSELMDDPRIDQDLLLKVLKDVNNANRLLGGNNITIQAVADLVKKHPRKEYTLIDMGCGEGSMLREVAHFFRNKKIKVRLIGMDLNEQAIAMGRERSKSYPEISFMQQDILQLTEEDLTCDILLCTLTMHHFRCEQIPQFLEQFVKLSTIGVVINDLQRSRLAYYLFKGFSAIFIRTKIAKHDGLISVRSGFTKKELIAFSKKLPQVKHSIRWKWAFRYVWMMQHH